MAFPPAAVTGQHVSTIRSTTDEKANDRQARGIHRGNRQGRQACLPHLKSKGYDLLNVDLKPFDHPGISTLIADLTHSGQASTPCPRISASTVRSRQAAGGAGRRRAFCRDTAGTDRAG